MSELVLRQMRSSDLNFVCDSWIRSYRSAKAVAGVSNQHYNEGQRRLAVELMSRSECVVASLSDDPDTIAGWLVVETPCIHFAYVRKELRGMGIFKQMVGQRRVTEYSHQTRMLDTARVKLAYNPFRK